MALGFATKDDHIPVLKFICKPPSVLSEHAFLICDGVAAYLSLVPLVQVGDMCHNSLSQSHIISIALFFGYRRIIQAIEHETIQFVKCHNGGCFNALLVAELTFSVG